MGIISGKGLLERQVSMRLFHRFSTFAVALAASSLITSSFAQPAHTAPQGPEGLADGPGVWVNMWNYPQVSDLEAYCLKLHNNGIRNLFIQTSRSNTEAITHPAELGAIIEACHRYRIHVIAWSFAELANPVGDADKLVAAARFRSPNGQQLDSIAANLEKDLNKAKVETYSQRLRSELGPKYPMVAVVYSPLNLAPQVALIPWKTLDHYYDVIAPMNYWNSKYKKLDPYDYTRSTIKRVRELVGRPDVEIHVIGDGMGTTSESVMQFMKACKDGEATSASLYPNFKVTAEQVATLSHYSDFFPVNSRFRLASMKELLKTGVLEQTAVADPAAPITRGDFYKLLVRQAYAGHAQASAGLTAESAANFLAHNGVLDMAHCPLPQDSSQEEALKANIDGTEAFAVVAALVETKTSGRQTHLPPGRTARNRGGHWFSQPAYAAESHRQSSAPGKPLDYLDAAQIVLQATSGLR
ncbi:MAG TPA: hypothetical protein V6C72_00155 [Chroococcales cyanobacterium]